MRRAALANVVATAILTQSSVVIGQSPLTPFRGLIDHVSATQSGWFPWGSVDLASHAVSGDGRFVVMSSQSSDIVPNDFNGLADVFLRDRTAGTTTRLSLAPNGSEGDGMSEFATISTNGRYVAFASGAQNLVAGDTNGWWDVFVRDLDQQQTVRVSIATDGTEGDVDSGFPALSADGRFVAFTSRATTLAPGVNPYSPLQAYVHDRDADGNGIFDEPGGISTTLVSVSATGEIADEYVDRLRVSSNGRLVLFETAASNLDETGNLNGGTHLYLRDMQAGTTIMVDRAVTGGPSAWGVDSRTSDMTDDGRFITFSSYSQDIVPLDMNWQSQVFRYDTAAPGATTIVSALPDGTLANSWSNSSAISGDGRYVAFMTGASNLAMPLPGPGYSSMVVRDMIDGTFTRVDVTGSGAAFDHDFPYSPSLSADGTALAFVSNASNPIDGQWSGGGYHVFVATAFSATPLSAAYPMTGGSGSIEVNTTAVSGWEASTFDPWITLMDGAAFAAGPRTVQYIVSSNDSGIVRNGSIRVGSTIISIHQDGDGDNTPPVVTPTVAGTLGANGWYTSDVAVTWSVSDPDSEIVSTAGCQPVTFTTDFMYAAPWCEATSHGGTTSVTVPIRRDANGPTITFGDPKPSIYPRDAVVATSFGCTDYQSGTATCTQTEGSSTLATATPGWHRVTVTATDHAGNTSSKSVEYLVGTGTCVAPAMATSNLKAWWPFNGNYHDNVSAQDGFNYLRIDNFQTAVAGQGWNNYAALNFLWAGAGSEKLAGAGLTIAAWVFPRSHLADYGPIVDNPMQYRIARFPDGTLRWAFAQTTGFTFVNTGVQLPSFAWSHIAITYKDGLVQTFVNGRLVHSSQLTGTLTTSGPTNLNMTIGGRQHFQPGGVASLSAMFDDVMIFDDALPPADIDGLALAGSGSLCVPFGSNVALTVPEEVPYGAQFTVTAVLTDDAGRPMPNRPMTISSILSPPGYVWQRMTDATGSATVSFPISSETTNGDYPNAITASFAGDVAYSPASAQADVTQVGGNVAVTWPQPAAIVYGTPLTASQLNATAAYQPGTFTYSPPAGTVLDAGTHTLTTTFTPNDLSHWAPKTVTTTIVVNKAAPTVAISSAPVFYTGYARPAIVFVRGVGGIELNPVTVLYNGSPTQPVSAGSYALEVQFAGAANYEAVTTNAAFVINKTSPIMSTLSDAAKTYDGQPWGIAVNIAGVNSEWLTPVITIYNGSVTEPVNTGIYTVEVRYDGSANYTAISQTFTLTILKAAPGLTWPQPVGVSYGNALSGVQLNASSDVPGAWAYSPAAGTVLNAGTHTLSASFTPADTVNYSSGSVSTTFAVSKVNADTVWYRPANIAYGTTLGAAELNATAPVPGTFTYTPATGTILGAGEHVLSVTFAPDDLANYNGSTAGVPLTVTKAAPALSWSSPADIGYGTALGAAQLSATANVAGTFAYSPTTGAVLAAGAQTLAVTFTPDDAANYTGSSANVTLNVTKAASSIAWTTPADIVYGTALGPAQLNATANVAGTFSYSPAAGSVLAAATHALSVTFTPSDAANYTGSAATRTLTISRAPLTMTANNASKPYGAPLPAFSATAGGFVNGESTASLSGTLSFVTSATASSPVGNYPVTPQGVSSSNYTIAFAGGSLSVVRASTATAVVASPNPNGLNQPVTLTAIVSVVAPGAGQPAGMVQFFDGGTLLGTASLVSGSASLTTNGFTAGSHAISASYGGNGSFDASSGNGTLTVNTTAASSATTVTSSANPVTAGQSVMLTATVTAPAGLTGSVAFYDGSLLLATLPLTGTTARLTTAALGTGGHAITARYLGNGTIPPSTSPAFAQYVQPSGAKTRTSTTTLTAVPSPVTLGSNVTLTATVTGSQNRAPAGAVTFMANGIVIGQGTLSATGSVTAATTFNTSALPHGTHKIEAVYLGDSVYRASARLISLVVN